MNTNEVEASLEQQADNTSFQFCSTHHQSIEEVSGNINKLASTKTTTSETDRGTKTSNPEVSKKVTFQGKNEEANEKAEVMEQKEDDNSGSEGHEVKHGRNASKSRKPQHEAKRVTQ